MATITIGNAQVTEGGKLVFPVDLSAPVTNAVRVAYQAQPGTATTADYAADPDGWSWLTFAPGQTHQTITVQTIDDVLIEAAEKMGMYLWAPQNATISDEWGDGVIVDNDSVVAPPPPPPPTSAVPTITVGDATTIEGGKLVFSVDLSVATTNTVRVAYQAQPDNNTSADYVADPNGYSVLSFAPGETHKTITVQTVDDLLVEAAETMRMYLWAPTNATIADSEAAGTIIDNDSVVPPPPPPPPPTGTLPPSVVNYHLTFADEFNTLNLRIDGQPIDHSWETKWWYSPSGGQSGGTSSWSIDANYGPTASVDPWSVSNGILTLEVAPAAPAILPYLHGKTYTSGHLDTHDSFAQTYGYFEMRAQMPAGQGLWPSFWLLPQNGAWPPELDVVEMLGREPWRIYETAHSGTPSNHTQIGTSTIVPDTSQGFHTYGMDWEPDVIKWYFDGQEIFSAPTQADQHQPMFLIVSFGTGTFGAGGTWTGGTADMHVDYVRAYASANTPELF